MQECRTEGGGYWGEHCVVWDGVVFQDLQAVFERMGDMKGYSGVGWLVAGWENCSEVRFSWC